MVETLFLPSSSWVCEIPWQHRQVTHALLPAASSDPPPGSSTERYLHRADSPRAADLGDGSRHNTKRLDHETDIPSGNSGRPLTPATAPVFIVTIALGFNPPPLRVPFHPLRVRNLSAENLPNR